MAARYILSGRRNFEPARQLDSGRTMAAKSIDADFSKRRPPQMFYSLSEISRYFGHISSSDHSSTTLQASEANPEDLAFVLLFGGANPRWESDNIIFVKSKLGLLDFKAEEPEENSSAPCRSAPIAIFQQDHPLEFEFKGWYTVSRLDFLEPQTPELIRMLEQKWQKKDRRGQVTQVERDSNAWRSSLSSQWAVVKFEKDETKTDVPVIERDIDDVRAREQKSVNQLLQEMRLKDTTKSEPQVVMLSKEERVDPLAEQYGNVQYCQTSPASKALFDPSTKSSGGEDTEAADTAGKKVSSTPAANQIFNHNDAPGTGKAQRTM